MTNQALERARAGNQDAFHELTAPTEPTRYGEAGAITWLRADNAFEHFGLPRALRYETRSLRLGHQVLQRAGVHGQALARRLTATAASPSPTS